MSEFAVGEPKRDASYHGVIDEWSMDVYGVRYKVNVIRFENDRNSIVTISVEAGPVTGQREYRTWTVMRHGRDGGVITPRFVRENLSMDPATSEHIAVLLASALGRPYVEQAAEE